MLLTLVHQPMSDLESTGSQTLDRALAVKTEDRLVRDDGGPPRAFAQTHSRAPAQL